MRKTALTLLLACACAALAQAAVPENGGPYNATVDVLGLVVGDRPAFVREGFWLYAGREPVVHLTACDADDPRAGGARGPGFFDHVAFKCTGLAGCVERLRRSGLPYEPAEVPSLRQVQLFVRDPAGVGVELNFADERPA